MSINSPLIKMSHTAFIINKTATLALLKNNEQEEREMAKLPLKQRIEQVATSGVETNIGAEVNKEQINALHAAFDKMASKYTNVFGRTSAFTPATVRASQATAAFFNAKQDTAPEPTNDQDNTPKLR